MSKSVCETPCDDREATSQLPTCVYRLFTCSFVNHCLFKFDLFAIVFYAFTFVLCNKDLLTYLLTYLLNTAPYPPHCVRGSDHTNVTVFLTYKIEWFSFENADVHKLGAGNAASFLGVGVKP